MTISLLRSVGSAIRSFRSKHLLRRPFVAGDVPERKVVILGADSGIGQPLSLLMKLNPLVTKLDLWTFAEASGISEELSHINTPAEVFSYDSEMLLGFALVGSDVVIIATGNKFGSMPKCRRDSIFDYNAQTVKFVCTAIAKCCPNALVNVITDPVNSMVPIAAEVFKKAGTYDEKKLFGVTTLDVVRAETLYARKAEVPISGVNVPVVGGHEDVTILPLFSQATPATNALSDNDIRALTQKTQDGDLGLLAMTRKAPTVSMAYACAVFADACLKGLNGFPDIVECSFVQSTVVPEIPFFASKVRLGKNGVEEVLGLGSLSEYEQQGLENLKAELKSSIEKGIKFAEGANQSPYVRSRGLIHPLPVY